MEVTGVNNGGSYAAYTENAARLTEQQQAELDRVRESIDRLAGMTVRAEDVVDISAAGRAAAQRPGEAAGGAGGQAEASDGAQDDAAKAARYDAAEKNAPGLVVAARSRKAARYLVRQRLDALLAESGGVEGAARSWGA